MSGRRQLRRCRMTNVSDDDAQLSERRTEPHAAPTAGLPCTGDHSSTVHRGRGAGSAPHEGRVGEGPLRAREPAVGLGRDRRTAHRDRAARSRARHQRRHRLRPLGSRRALRATAGSCGPRRGGGMRYFELPPAEQRRRLDRRQPKSRTRRGTGPTRHSPRGLPSSASRRKGNSTAVTCRSPAGRIRDLGGWRRHRWPVTPARVRSATSAEHGAVPTARLTPIRELDPTPPLGRGTGPSKRAGPLKAGHWGARAGATWRRGAPLRGVMHAPEHRHTAEGNADFGECPRAERSSAPVSPGSRAGPASATGAAASTSSWTRSGGSARGSRRRPCRSRRASWAGRR